MHHCPVPLSQGARGAPARTWSWWVLLSAPKLPDARAPQQGLSSRGSLDAQGNANAPANAEMGTFKILFCKSTPAKDSLRENSWRVKISKLNHSGSHLLVLMVG